MITIFQIDELSQEQSGQEEPDPFEFEAEGEDGTPAVLRPRASEQVDEPFKILAEATAISSERYTLLCVMLFCIPISHTSGTAILINFFLFVNISETSDYF